MKYHSTEKIYSTLRDLIPAPIYEETEITAQDELEFETSILPRLKERFSEDFIAKTLSEEFNRMLKFLNSEADEHIYRKNDAMRSAGVPYSERSVVLEAMLTELEVQKHHLKHIINNLKVRELEEWLEAKDVPVLKKIGFSSFLKLYGTHFETAYSLKKSWLNQKKLNSQETDTITSSKKLEQSSQRQSSEQETSSSEEIISSEQSSMSKSEMTTH